MKTFTVQMIILTVAVMSCAYTLHNSFNSYIDVQKNIENQVREKANKIRIGALNPSADEMAKWLEASADRWSEKYTMKFYVYLSIATIVFALLTYLGGFILGRKEALKETKDL